MLPVLLVLLPGLAAAQPAPQATPVALTLSNAIDRALEHNVRVLTSELQVEGAQGARWRALAGLLPQIDARGVATRQTTNLAAFGFDTSLFPGIPEVVGPFNVFDARVVVSQPVFDLSALHDARRSAHMLAAARLDQKDVRDFVTLAATTVYLQAVASAKRIDTARAQVATADSLLTLATELHDAGVTPGIDTVRAKVQIGVQRQRLIEAETTLAKLKLQLARVLGLPAAQPIELTDREVSIALLPGTVDEAVQRAKATRADYQAALARVRAAEEERRAAAAEALPSLHANADIGMIGSTPSNARRTYAISGAVRVPLFNADRKARAVEAAAVVRQREAEAAELAQQVETDVRSAYLDVQAAEQQLAAARERVDLANQELSLARTRFAAGVANNLEVIQAQNGVAAAAEDEIAGVYALNIAKASLLRMAGG
jgi:outer membrane protein TolC